MVRMWVSEDSSKEEDRDLEKYTTDHLLVPGNTLVSGEAVLGGR